MFKEHVTKYVVFKKSPQKKTSYNIFEYFIFIMFIPNHTTCFHSILKTIL